LFSETLSAVTRRRPPRHILVDASARTLVLALNGWPGLGPARLRQLRERAGSWAALADGLAGCWPLLGDRCGPCPGPAALAEVAAHEERALVSAGARLLIEGEPDWPTGLGDLQHPPPVLFLLGSAAALAGSETRVAVIGARACTPYGREQAARFGAGLAGLGVAVVSGAARGIDQCAMLGALEAGGRVVAVLGCGLDRAYPPDAAPLLARVAAEGGAVLSEFPFGTPPQAGNFPRRNRILAALARAIVVVQATRRSGSMNTVAWGLSLGREVFAVPGPVDCAASQGPHMLLREGAALAEGPLDLLREGSTGVEAPDPERDPPLLSELARGDRTLAQLAESLAQPEDALLLELVELEMRGRVVRRPGGAYHRCGPARAGPTR
jgi:DNA processing protein